MSHFDLTYRTNADRARSRRRILVTRATVAVLLVLVATLAAEPSYRHIAAAIGSPLIAYGIVLAFFRF